MPRTFFDQESADLANSLVPVRDFLSCAYCQYAWPDVVAYLTGPGCPIRHQQFLNVGVDIDVDTTVGIVGDTFSNLSDATRVASAVNAKFSSFYVSASSVYSTLKGSTTVNA